METREFQMKRFNVFKNSTSDDLNEMKINDIKKYI